MHELLNPNRLDIENTFKTQFEGMVNVPVKLQELLDTREELINIINKALTDNERHFLLSVKQGKPDWALLELKGIDQLPAIRWKLQNIEKMPKDKHTEYIENLKAVLNL
jgi:hypothetical protein